MASSWRQPTGDSSLEKLRLYNSLTRQKDEFIPQSSKKVLWYSCGPTVYDSSHMGHARTFITFDILRRVMRDYFHYDIVYCMNITDIDDKIIKRARQNFLFETYAAQQRSLSALMSDVMIALSQFGQRSAAETDPAKQQMHERIQRKVEAGVTSLEHVIQTGDSASIEAAKATLLLNAKDILVEWLDLEKGASVTDNEVFQQLPRHFEAEFHRDMLALNVLAPDVVTRVSEFIPEIVSYIEQIMANKFAYESNGSVYFDTVAFSTSSEHVYAKLVPEAVGDMASLNEGEGALSVSADRLREKKNPTDFALWKASKQGEPSWPSPWGPGRPGWHIECSVMASQILGPVLDIHSGGYDLKFPHHDNEIAQAEAYFAHNQWVNYFLHSGHLTISGCKMSKSLKNFITIQDALKEHSARQLRLAFLMHCWKDGLDYGARTMEGALQYERMLSEFFLNIKDQLRTPAGADVSATYRKWSEELEMRLHRSFMDARLKVHAALCDNIDTRSVLDCLKELITSTNIYIQWKRSQKSTGDALLLKDIAHYITFMLKTFGLISGAGDEFGWETAGGAAGGADAEATALTYVGVLSEFRERVRQFARARGADELLQLCDRVRDDDLVNVGVRLEDHEGVAPTIKLVDRDTLLKERELKVRAETERQRARDAARLELQKLQLEKDAKARVPAELMFRHETDKYSAFDDNGVPTVDADGKEISKSQRKKLLKLWEQQKKKNADCASAAGAD